MEIISVVAFITLCISAGIFIAIGLREITHKIINLLDHSEVRQLKNTWKEREQTIAEMNAVDFWSKRIEQQEKILEGTVDVRPNTPRPPSLIYSDSYDTVRRTNKPPVKSPKRKREGDYISYSNRPVISLERPMPPKGGSKVRTPEYNKKPTTARLSSLIENDKLLYDLMNYIRSNEYVNTIWTEGKPFLTSRSYELDNQEIVKFVDEYFKENPKEEKN